MKIDLEKELAIQMAPQKTQIWVKLIAGISILNLILIFFVIFSEKTQVSNQTFSEKEATYLSNIKKLNSRLKSLEKTFRDIKVNQKYTKKTLSVVAAEQNVSKKKDRKLKLELKKAGITEKDMRKAIRKTMFPQQTVSELDPKEKIFINSLIDSDDTSLKVKDFITAVTNIYKRDAYLEYIRNKGDQWLNAALPLVSEDRNVFDEYFDNALYFYDIVAAISKNNAMIAYVEAKKNQADLLVQNDNLILEMEEVARQQEDIESIKEDIKPKMTRREAADILDADRRKHIKKYPTSDIVHKLKTDWEIDPVKRLEQKRNEENE